MTTIRAAAEMAVSKAISARTEELFRRSGALKKATSFSRAASTRSGIWRSSWCCRILPPRASCAAFGRRGIATRRGAGGGPRRRPDDGRHRLAFETGRQLGVRAIFAEEVNDADGATRPRVPAAASRSPRASGCCSSTTS